MKKRLYTNKTSTSPLKSSYMNTYMSDLKYKYDIFFFVKKSFIVMNIYLF